MNKKDMFYFIHFEQYSLDKDPDTGNINRGPLLTVAENQKAFEKVFEKAFPDLYSIQKDLSKKDYENFLYSNFSFRDAVHSLLSFYKEVISNLVKNHIHGTFNEDRLSLKETEENYYYYKLLKRIEATIYCLVMEDDDFINNHLDDLELVNTVKEADDD